jgi:ferritin-like metal-binding protein YciE
MVDVVTRSYAEKKIVKALPKMAKKATSPDLKAGFEKHLEETEGQIERLDEVFELIEKPAKGKKCSAIDGILEEGAEIMEEHEPGAVLDAAMAAAAQAVEHYEMARYGTLVDWAMELGLNDAKKLLAETLAQEEATDEALREMTTSRLNAAANENSDEASQHKTAMKSVASKPAQKVKPKRAA